MKITRNDYLVSQKFYEYLIPSFLTEFALHTGTVIDAVIVGNLIGVDALSAVTLSNPVIQILYSYARANNRMLRFYLSGVEWLKNIFEALKIGLPRVTLEIMQALQIFILNTAVLQMLGVEAMEIYAVCTNTLIMAELLAGGIISVIPNICGVLYGEKDYFAIRRLMKKILSLSCGLILILTVGLLLFPEKIAIMFGMD